MKCIVTGGAGFVGSYFVRMQREKYPDDTLVNVDALADSGNMQNISMLAGDPGHIFVHADITDMERMSALFDGGVDAVVNFAAQSDGGASDSGRLLNTNVMGVQALLELCRQHGCRFVQVSADGVYGSIDRGFCHEDSPLAPSNTYAAGKAAADMLVHAYRQTYGLDALITRSTNNYGPYQHPEKLIPRMLLRALRNDTLPAFGDGLHARDWIHVGDHCAAVDLVMRKGVAGETYNVSAGNERTTLDIIKYILDELGKPASLVSYTADRPGHDRRRALANAKIRRLGWRPTVEFDEELRRTLQWYQSNEDWWRSLTSGAQV